MNATTQPVGFDPRAARTSRTEPRPNTLIARSDSLNTRLPSSVAVALGTGKKMLTHGSLTRKRRMLGNRSFACASGFCGKTTLAGCLRNRAAKMADRVMRQGANWRDSANLTQVQNVTAHPCQNFTFASVSSPSVVIDILVKG